MPRRLSNSERIARAAAEAKATADEKAAKKTTRKKSTKKAAKKTTKKAAKKTAKKKTTKRTRKSAPAVAARMKIVWAVGAPGAVPVKTYPYKERKAADAEAAKIGKGCIVKALRVPMEDPAEEETPQE